MGISEDTRVSECCLTPSDQLVNYSYVTTVFHVYDVTPS